MGIRSRTGEERSVAEGWRAVELFTDRLWARRVCATWLDGDPPPERILYLYGDGGNGKSLLLRYLGEKAAKRLSPDNWSWLASLSDAEMASQLDQAQDVATVPVAYLDFGAQPHGE